jgi:two-component system chemotaxis response regulator CheB
VSGDPPGREPRFDATRHEPWFDIVVIGASAGGVRALLTVLGDLPDPFPVAIGLVLHLSRDHASILPKVLARRTRRRVEWATQGSPLEPGTIYIAPRNRHFEIDARGKTTLATTPRVQFSRPSIDLLFESAAKAYGDRTLAVLLTGNGADGSAGATAVFDAGGLVIAQDEASSEYFGMPRQAIQSGAATIVLPLGAIAAAITRLVEEGRSSEPPSTVEGPNASVRPPDGNGLDARLA